MKNRERAVWPAGIALKWHDQQRFSAAPASRMVVCRLDFERSSTA